jgi:glycosyltransferase involved in cell wall biosynthesis
MRVLRIHSLEGPHRGGVEDYIASANRALASRGHEARNLLFSAHPVQFDDPSAVTLHRSLPRFGLRRTLRKSANWTKDVDWINLQALEFHPDVIHLHNVFAALPAVAGYVNQTRIPVVMTVHGSDPNFPIDRPPRAESLQYFPWHGLFDREVVPKIRTFICPSSATREYLDAHHYGPTAMVRPFIHHTEPAPNHQPATGPFRLGYLGRLEAGKGLPELVRAWRDLHRKGKNDLTLSIAGSGPWPIPRDPGIIDSGYVAGPEKDRWFASIDALIIPSRSYENLSLVAVEALSRDVPVIATANGGLREVLDDGRYGSLLSPKFHPAELALAIEYVRDHYAEALVRTKKGQEFVRKEFTEKRHLEQLIPIYQAAIGRGAFR